MLYICLTLVLVAAFVMRVCLNRIRGASLLALLLRRAEFVEVVELAAGEHRGVFPLAVLFLLGSLDPLATMHPGLQRALPPFLTG